MSETFAESAPSATAPRNRLLRHLPKEELASLGPFLEPCALPQKCVLFEPLRPVRYVHFIEDGIASIVSLMSDRSAVEIATVGFEGMVGMPAFWGGMSSASQAVMQVAGHGLRMEASVLREETTRGGALAEALGRYTQAMVTMVAQSSACNRLHQIERRCARWLLTTHDRVHGDTFDLTQLFLAQMLGVRRASVSEAAHRLQGQGLIRYARGRITILDRGGLETAACECYHVVAAEFDRLLNGREAENPLDGIAFSEGGRTTTTAKPD